MNLDRTFCASPDCKNECGRKMSEELNKCFKDNPWYPVSYAYFCGEPKLKEHNRD
ncbi:hypothetical protein UFOVP100_13 [uncultured Caudovirales phage]|uniref:Uncharacterized protein n=1 Tax=uncultured Caudovirales phage TaxID=2100421 RepID=A0A6J5L4I8_9CAUD|nr:hypothetical protein UFOVP100_13 [uncultured Caudovirales phage]